MITEVTMIAFKVVIKRQEQDGTPVFTSINPNYLWAREYRIEEVTRPHPIAERLGFPLLCFENLESALIFADTIRTSRAFRAIHVNTPIVVIYGSIVKTAYLERRGMAYNELDRQLFASRLRHSYSGKSGMHLLNVMVKDGLEIPDTWPDGTIGVLSFRTLGQCFNFDQMMEQQQKENRK